MGYPTGDPAPTGQVPIYLSVGAGTRHEVGCIHLAASTTTPRDTGAVSVTFEPPSRDQLADLLEAAAAAIRGTGEAEHG